FPVARRKGGRQGVARRCQTYDRERVQDHTRRADARRDSHGRSMKFDKPAATNPIDQLKIVGKPFDRVDGPLKTTGRAPYAYERHDAVANPAYGYIVASAISKGRVLSMDLAEAKAAPGVLAIVTSENAGELGKSDRNTARLLGGPEIQHYHQAIGIVVADS